MIEVSLLSAPQPLSLKTKPMPCTNCGKESMAYFAAHGRRSTFCRRWGNNCQPGSLYGTQLKRKAGFAGRITGRTTLQLWRYTVQKRQESQPTINVKFTSRQKQ